MSLRALWSPFRLDLDVRFEDDKAKVTQELRQGFCNSSMLVTISAH